MGKPRSLLRSLSIGTSGRRHSCKADEKHELLKGDRMLVVKIDRDDFHYCTDCALKFINTAQLKLSTLEEEIRRRSPEVAE